MVMCVSVFQQVMYVCVPVCVYVCVSICGASEALQVVAQLTLQAELPQKSQLHIAIDPRILLSLHLIGPGDDGGRRGRGRGRATELKRKLYFN